MSWELVCLSDWQPAHAAPGARLPRRLADRLHENFYVCPMCRVAGLRKATRRRQRRHAEESIFHQCAHSDGRPVLDCASGALTPTSQPTTNDQERRSLATVITESDGSPSGALPGCHPGHPQFKNLRESLLRRPGIFAVTAVKSRLPKQRRGLPGEDTSSALAHARRGGCCGGGSLGLCCAWDRRRGRGGPRFRAEEETKAMTKAPIEVEADERCWPAAEEACDHRRQRVSSDKSMTTSG